MASRIRDHLYNAAAGELLISRSLHEYRIFQGLTTYDNVAAKVSLQTRLCRLPSQDRQKKYNRDDIESFLMLNNPVLGAAMRCVSAGAYINVALSQHGSIAPVARSIPIDDQVETVKGVKRFKAGFQEEVLACSLDHKIEYAYSLMEKKGYKRIFVTQEGTPNGKYVGVLEKDKIRRETHYGMKISDVAEALIKKIKPVRENIRLEEVKELMNDRDSRVLPVVDDDGMLISVAFMRDYEKHIEFKDSEIVDSEKRYLCAAAVSTHPKDRDRIDALANIIDALFIDASDGYSVFQKETLEYIRGKNPRLPVIGGNVITKEGFRYLVDAGFDAVKLGMGIGSGCTTQQEKGTGRGMATTIIEIVHERNKYYAETGKYIPLIADGSMSNTSLMAIALALGVDCVMVGGWIAGFTESPSHLQKHKGYEWGLKEYYMEASEKAQNWARYQEDAAYFFIEGVEGWVPHKGSIYDKGTTRDGVFYPGKNSMNKSLQKIKSAISTAGCRTITEFHDKAVVEVQSEYALRDAGVHDIIQI